MQESCAKLYVGTYTGSDSKGIYAFLIRPDQSSFTPLGCIARSSNPSYLHGVTRAKMLYAVDETTGPSKADGAVLAYRVNAHAKTIELTSQTSSFGVGPCFLAADSKEKHLFAANYHSGSICCIGLRNDGSLDSVTSRIQLHGSSTDPARQRSSHPHAIIISPDDKHVIVADLGADELLVFSFDASSGVISGKPTNLIRFPPGSGPRHLAIHPSGEFLYVIHEIRSIITVHRFGGKAVLSPTVQTVATVPTNSPGHTDGADILIDPSGAFLYTTARATSTIRSYRIASATGELQEIADVSSNGRTPQALCFSPDGTQLLVANLDSSSIDIFSVAEGRLLHREALSVPSPSFLCIG